eukprot:jgi/Bigna1/70119/fgenesh1_pg.11_\
MRCNRTKGDQTEVMEKTCGVPFEKKETGKRRRRRGRKAKVEAVRIGEEGEGAKAMPEWQQRERAIKHQKCSTSPPSPLTKVLCAVHVFVVDQGMCAANNEQDAPQPAGQLKVRVRLFIDVPTKCAALALALLQCSRFANKFQSVAAMNTSAVLAHTHVHHGDGRDDRTALPKCDKTLARHELQTQCLELLLVRTAW